MGSESLATDPLVNTGSPGLDGKYSIFLTHVRGSREMHDQPDFFSNPHIAILHPLLQSE